MRMVAEIIRAGLIVYTWWLLLKFTTAPERATKMDKVGGITLAFGYLTLGVIYLSEAFFR